MTKRLYITSLTKLASTLERLPKGLGQVIAKRAAPVISRLAKASFDRSVDPYGTPWKPKDDGSKATLRRTGALEKFVVYVAIGTRIRVALGVPYAKYQIGARPIYPRQDRLPVEYREEIHAIVKRTALDFMQGRLS